MMKHPLNRAYTPSSAFPAPTLATSHLITIARQDAEIRAMRRKLDAIEGLANDVNFRPKTLGGLLVFLHAVKQVLQERP